MPPKGEALSKDEVALVKRWIDTGAIWKETDFDRAAARDHRLDHWAFQSIKAVKPPELPPAEVAAAAVAGDIDQFIRARLIEQHLRPAPAADRRTLLRRLWLDMLG